MAVGDVQTGMTVPFFICDFYFVLCKSCIRSSWSCRSVSWLFCKRWLLSSFAKWIGCDGQSLKEPGCHLCCLLVAELSILQEFGCSWQDGEALPLCCRERWKRGRKKYNLFVGGELLFQVHCVFVMAPFRKSLFCFFSPDSCCTFQNAWCVLLVRSKEMHRKWFKCPNSIRFQRKLISSVSLKTDPQNFNHSLHRKVWPSRTSASSKAECKTLSKFSQIPLWKYCLVFLIMAALASETLELLILFWNTA